MTIGLRWNKTSDGIGYIFILKVAVVTMSAGREEESLDVLDFSHTRRNSVGKSRAGWTGNL
jgi:hypothetical protein